MKLNLTIYFLLPLAALLLAGCAGRATNGMVETPTINPIDTDTKLIVPPPLPGLSALPQPQTVAGTPSLAVIAPVLNYSRAWWNPIANATEYEVTLSTNDFVFLVLKTTGTNLPLDYLNIPKKPSLKFKCAVVSITSQGIRSDWAYNGTAHYPKPASVTTNILVTSDRPTKFEASADLRNWLPLLTGTNLNLSPASSLTLLRGNNTNQPRALLAITQQTWQPN